MTTDDQLMLATREGDRRAFERLVQLHRAKVSGFLRRMLRNDALAEEAALETFFKVHRAASTYEARGEFKTFLYRIAYHEGLRAMRGGRSMRDSERVDVDLEHGAYQPSSGSDPEKQLEQRQLLERVEQALSRLPEIQRAVFLLYYREDMATEEIAAVAQIPSGSVRAYLTMARRALRERLEKEERVHAGA